MANVNSPFGFRPINRDSGGPFFTRAYGKAASDPTAIFMYDLVLKAATSIPPPGTGIGAPLPGITSGQNGTPGTSLWLGSSINYGAANSATPHYVVDSIDSTFIAQAAPGASFIQTAGFIGKNANVRQGSGNLITKQSTFGLDDPTMAATAGMDCRMLRIYNVGSNTEGQSAILEVIFLKSASGQNTAGT